jgi:glutamyl/glutaminyl-tRNA synthetase
MDIVGQGGGSDPVIVGWDGVPEEGFADAVDDWDMKVSHVVRDGARDQGLTGLQVMLCKMLEIDPPMFAHLPTINNIKGV